MCVRIGVIGAVICGARCVAVWLLAFVQAYCIARIEL
jgi:hypothetical protein